MCLSLCAARSAAVESILFPGFHWGGYRPPIQKSTLSVHCKLHAQVIKAVRGVFITIFLTSRFLTVPLFAVGIIDELITATKVFAKK